MDSFYYFVGTSMNCDLFYLTLYIINLVIFEIYFLVMTIVSHLKKIGVFQRLGYFLEFAIYSLVVLQLGHLIIHGIQNNRKDSVILRFIEIAYIEIIVFLFLLRKCPVFLSRNISVEVEKAVKKQNTPASIMYVVGLALLWLLTILFWLFVPDTSSLILLMPLIGILMVLCLFCVLWHLQFERSMLRLEQESQVQQKQKETDYMNSVDEQYQRTRELWHDLKNHINVMQILVHEQKYKEMEEYLSSFQRDVERRMIPYQTGNSAVDALLSYKLYQIQRKGIYVSMRICSLSSMQIPSRDICAILGNLLDNALEACEQISCQEVKRQIRIVLKYQDNFYYLNISNSANKIDKVNVYESSKKDKDNVVGHGLGLRSVERIVHQYGGFMTIQYQDGQFVVCLRMENKDIVF